MKQTGKEMEEFAFLVNFKQLSKQMLRLTPDPPPLHCSPKCSERKMRPCSGRPAGVRRCDEMWTASVQSSEGNTSLLSHHEVSPPHNIPTRPGPGGNLWAVILSLWRHRGALWRNRPGGTLLITIISPSCCHLLYSLRLGLSTCQNECVQRPRRHERIQACCHYGQQDVYCFYPFPLIKGRYMVYCLHIDNTN